MDDFVKFSDDETVVKNYHAANINKPHKGQANVILTNKRAIISYSTTKSVIVNDVNIDDVRGADIAWTDDVRNLKFIAGAIILGIIMMASSMVSMPESLFMLGIGLPSIGIGIYLLVRKKKPTFIIIIYSKSITPTLLIHNVTTRFMNQNGDSFQLQIDGTPGPDAKLMAGEIGVIIQDIQKSKVNSSSD